MKNSFYSKEIYTNLYERPSSQSKVCTQMIYGEKFKILIKKKNGLKLEHLLIITLGILNI